MFPEYLGRTTGMDATEYATFRYDSQGSLHESGSSFNPERHLKFNSCSHEMELRLTNQNLIRIEALSDSCTDHHIFFGDFSTFTFMKVRE